MSEPLISIITPCYNAAPFLKHAIESVLAQTHKNFEWILVNDGSTDETEAIIHAYKDERIRYYKQENKGQCTASNFGLSKANGAYIKFFDADDVMNARHLEAQLKILGNRTDALASSAWGRFYNNDPFSAQFIPEQVWKSMSSLDWIKASLGQKNDMMAVWLWLIPRNIINATGGWDERLSLNNDFEFSMRLLSKVKSVLFAPDAKIYYRSGNASLSGIASHEAYSAALLSTELGINYLLSMEDSSDTRRLAADRYQEWLYRIYPFFPDFQVQVQRQIKFFGGSSKKYDGGWVFQLIVSLFGWRVAKILKEKLKSLGYQKLPFN